MSQRISPVEHITMFYELADEASIAVMNDVIKGIQRRRFGKPKPKKRRPRLVAQQLNEEKVA